MNTAVSELDHYVEDRAATLSNRAALDANRNLLFWYRQLYAHPFRNLPPPEGLKILEIGGGVSPRRRFQLNVLTSDVLELNYLDYVFGCHAIDQFALLKDESLDVITLTNVLHHLQSPLDFSIRKPELAGDLLSSANEPLPWLIFTRPAWGREIEGTYKFESQPLRPFTVLAYFAKGGLSHRLPIPLPIYRLLFAFDLCLSRFFRRVCAAFFTITLQRK